MSEKTSTFDVELHSEGFSRRDREALRSLVDLGQDHLFLRWPRPGLETERKRKQLAVIRDLDDRYPGGIAAYLANARVLLQRSRDGDNPYASYSPAIPTGKRLEFGSAPFAVANAAGLATVNRAAFMLVAGGLGERLGFDRIKVALSAETATGRSFLQLYIEHILALQAAGNRITGEQRKIPFAIMTSDQTFEATQCLLEENSYFHMDRDQVTLLKQEQVAALADGVPTIATSEDDPYSIETKPYGHGEVHALLHQTGLASRWLDEGASWLVFFQDTNALTFHAIPAALGVSAAERFCMNSVVVPRRAGEAMGGIVRLTGEGREYTLNVEYNQLDPLLRSASGKGDVADSTGYSPYPGNTNVFVVALPKYVEVLRESCGAVPEFVNPKYLDDDRTRLAKPARLECMMQDYPKLLDASAPVGFTQFDRQLCYSPVKNDLGEAARRQLAGLPPDCPSSGEADLYAMHRRFISAAGAEVEEAESIVCSGVELALFPIVVLAPALLTTVEGLATRFSDVHLSSRSVLIVDADDVEIHGLCLDGALEIRAVPGAKVIVRGLEVRNDSWGVEEVDPDTESDPEAAIRGVRFRRDGHRRIEITEPGEHIIEG